MTRLDPRRRDHALARISSATRWLTAGGLAVTGLTAVYVAGALPGASGNTTKSTTNGAAAPTTTTTLPAQGATPVPQTLAPVPQTLAPRVQVQLPPIQHTRSRGS